MQNKGIVDDLLNLHKNEWERDFRRQALWYWVKKSIKQESHVLDIGCGTGFMSVKLLHSGNKITAVDPEKKLIDHLRKNVSIEKKLTLKTGALGEGQLKYRNRFDTVLCLDVLEHINYDEKALLEIKTMLKKSGTLIFSVPAIPYLYGKRDMQIGHFRRYSYYNLRQKFTNTGFSIKTIQYWNFLGILPYFISEKIFRQKMTDNIRQGKSNLLKKLIGRIIYFWLRLEITIKPPLGLSLLVTATKD